MTGKLILYEFRAVLRLMAAVWIALPVMALLLGLTIRLDQSFDNTAEEGLLGRLFLAGGENLPEVLQNIAIFLFGGVFAALGAVTVLMVILRFYRGLLRDEGYLMHTLPVKCWQLITAKGVVAVCLTLGSMIVAVLSVMGLVLVTDPAALRSFFWRLGGILTDEPVLAGLLAEIALLALAYSLATIYKAYASMAIGQLAQRHRVLLSVAAYLGIGVAGLILSPVLGNLWFGPLVQWAESYRFNALDASILLAIGLLIAAQLVKTAVYHIIAVELLQRRLNLE